MTKRVLYRNELPNPEIAGDGDIEGIQQYWLAIFSKLQHMDQRQHLLLPSVAEVAEELQLPTESVWEGLLQVRNQSPLEIDIRTGYYGGLTANHR